MTDAATLCFCAEHCNGAVCGGRPGLVGSDLCLDGGRRHAWKNTGLDVVKVPGGWRDYYTACCVWCPKTSRRDAKRGPIKDGVRRQP